jgi:hypothetical protein
MADALKLRDMWQHHVDEALRIVEQRGQVWGALAWAQHKNGRSTGQWFAVVIGSALKGSTWFFAGPAKDIPRVDTRRIRLLHAGQEVYLARLVRDMFEAVHHLEQDLSNGRFRLVGDAVDQPRSSDWVLSAVIQVLVGVGQNPGDE